jgi:Flp pilus assembly protein CpaB
MSHKMIEWKENEKKESSEPHKSKNKFIIPLFFALVATLLQFFLFKSISYFTSDSIYNNHPPLVVAKNNMRSGHITSEEDFKLAEINVGKAQEYFILNTEIDNFIGKKVLVNIKENTPLLKNSFMNPFQKNSLPEKIPFGKRLYVLDLDFGSLGPHLRVGDKIDLIAYLDIPGFGKATETILNGIQIIGIGEQLEDRAKTKNANSLSFYIYPEEVKILSFMKQYASFSVSLRNPNDSSANSGEAMTLNKFIQDERIQRIIKKDTFQLIQGAKNKK